MFTALDNVTHSAATTSSNPFRHSTGVTVFIVIITSLISIWCIIGNLLVITAVFRIKKLRTASNFLIISLAISDLLVGLFVMPLAILSVILEVWPLGQKICSMWVTFDVICCTCSILTLMMITIDRYLCINKALYYPRYRKAKLMVFYIGVAWIVSLLIGVTPLFLNWLPDFSPDNKGCKVNQSIKYQLYATIVAFYAPLTVMLCLYGKIYFISKKYARAEAKDNPKLENNNDEDSMTPSYNSSYNESPVAEVRNGTGKDAVNHEPTVSLSINKSAELQIKYEISDHVIAEDSNSIEVASETDWLREKEHQNNHLSVESAYHSHHNHFSDSHRHHHHPHHHHHHHNHHHHHHHSKFGSGPLKKLSAVTISSVKRFLQRRKNKHNSHAIRTLGVIMGLFTACWAPFFVLAVVSPLCGSACNIPGYLYSIFLWIGYVNSCFNPIVYARFNRQFRTPFREIICCRCSQLTQSIRHTDYIDQYGPDEEKHEGHSVGHGHTH